MQFGWYNLDVFSPKRLFTEILLADLNDRYEPSDNSGRITYTGNANIGIGNRYTNVHPCFFISSSWTHVLKISYATRINLKNRS